MKKQQRMDPAEVEFLAEHETVTILPNFQEKKLYFLTVTLFKSLYLNYCIGSCIGRP